jgi:putative transposase
MSEALPHLKLGCQAASPEGHIHIARTYRGKERNFTGENFWARGYFVSTVGADEDAVREYIRDQEQEDIRLDQLKLFK